jgi:uncharacterized protein
VLGKEYISSLFKLSRKVFRGSGIKVKLGVQTNMTLLDSEYIYLLKKHRVKVGMSYDVEGSQRKFPNGKSADQAIVEKMILMFNEGMIFSPIVVIHKKNYRKAKQIFEFYKKIHISFHAVIMDPWTAVHCPELRIDAEQYCVFLKDLADCYFEQKPPKISVPNVEAYIDLLKLKLPRERLCLFSRSCLGRTMFVEPNGDVFPCDNLRFKDLHCGNVLKEPVDRILNSRTMKRLKKRPERIERECKACKYLEVCWGGCMAYAQHEGNVLGHSKTQCYINREMFEYVGNKLKATGRKVPLLDIQD